MYIKFLVEVIINKNKTLLPQKFKNSKNYSIIENYELFQNKAYLKLFLSYFPSTYQYFKIFAF